jgi:RNA polymerase sigma factor (sigma-70 family)
LYAACRSTDPLIQAAAYETLWGYLFRVALQITRDQPRAEALAQDCAQDALIRVHKRLEECRRPAAFRAWARRIVINLALDALRRAKRETLAGEDEWERTSTSAPSKLERKVLANELFALISQAPISDRSRRVVLGRYLNGLPDELLAQEESRRAARSVRPSHVQVTRSKDLSRLRDWEPLQAFRD